MPRKAKVAPAPPATGETLAVEYWPIARPQPYPRNARRLSDRAVDTLAASIENFGFRQPIVVDAKDVIVVGHTRLLAAQKLGLALVPVHVAAGLTPAQCRAYRLMDNRTADETSWDLDLLEAEMRELQALDMAELSGFEDAQITEMLKPPPATDPDAVPDAPAVPVSRTGDLWLLGSHRVLCGDATDGEAVARLCGPDKADMVFTDPPYGVSFERGKFTGRSKKAKGRVFAPIENDDLQGEGLSSFIQTALTRAFEACGDAASIYCWSPCLIEGLTILTGITAAGFKIQSQIIWNKRPFVIGRADYHWKHEVCWYGFKGKNHAWYGGRDKATVWDVPKPQVMDLHPTTKPTLLAEIACQNSTKSGDVVLDVFGGSGSTLIACEKLARRAHLMELAPAYVDVIVARWQAFTGLKATLADDGRTFEETGATRLHETEKESAKEAPAKTAPAKAKARGKQKTRVPQSVSRHRVAH